tara:strand:- start:689 stop:883 length:195 start_codon:yes stop_codon:yes gene_type:complete
MEAGESPNLLLEQLHKDLGVRSHPCPFGHVSTLLGLPKIKYATITPTDREQDKCDRSSAETCKI